MRAYSRWLTQSCTPQPSNLELLRLFSLVSVPNGSVNRGHELASPLEINERGDKLSVVLELTRAVTRHLPSLPGPEAGMVRVRDYIGDLVP